MSYRRGWIAVFLFSLAMINYMDRIALSIAAKPIAEEFHLTSVGMGYLFSSFIWSYALFLIPVGLLIDRYGVKRVGGIGIFIWSLATALTGAASSFASLLTARLVMGAGESVSNPVGAKVIREWIPSTERGTITAIFNSGSYAGPAICSLVLAALVAAFGWRLSFVIAGGIGFAWLLVWFFFYGKPEQVSWLSEQERSLIIERRAANGGRDTDAQTYGLKQLLKTPTLWGLALAQGCNVYTQYLFLTWLPSYLQDARHLTIAKSGLFTAIPYSVAVILCIGIGKLSDHYLKKGSGAASGKRRNVIALTMLISSCLLLIPVAQDITQLVVIFSLTLAGIAATTSLNFTLLNDLLPSSGDVGRAMAFVVVGGNVFGMLAPVVTGYVISATGSYNWAFGIAGGLLLTGALVILSMTRKPMIAKERLSPLPSSALATQSP
ncbi:MFS transporter [Pseudomonas gingeri]|uniref:MFS transporter n=2 Tax=Pseudomonas gingeri TaxID=117681 RepID=A0A7Y7YJU5_9PSED|nr:MFS transporter [Pseudomonas gingeri]NWB31910.1 MFS transporter [Pseudomonas gingeri]NWC37465.1 MFS transporter [Pseudomonas gingeri]NWD05564.1 MFS transporter [Pseudomonas gingeri]NWE35816.1 MFS transporter [Pseudomonas gingeri]NWE57975.1 MFS transporter [Pseudomonas gingeri]